MAAIFISKYPKRIGAILLVILLSNNSCEKFVHVEGPATSVNTDIVYSLDATATAVLTDVYNRMTGSLTGETLTSLSFYPGLSSDEFILYSGVSNIGQKAYYENALSPSIDGMINYWTPCYSLIYVANAAIEGLNNSTKLTPAVKQQLTGEAKFVRAFCYFYLVNLYGDVPLNISTDYKANSVRPRASASAVYNQIITDLKEAQTLLSPNFINASHSNTNERTRPNKYAATAMLSRAYLFNGDFVNAEIEASKIINNTSDFEMLPVDDVFLKNSRETIWALQPTETGTNSNTPEGRTFILSSVTPPSSSLNPVFLRNGLVNMFSANDKRNNWLGKYTDVLPDPDIDYYFPFKYKIGNVIIASSEYSVVLRLSEQYLIRAEARMERGDFTGAAADLNVVRQRAEIPNTAANDRQSLIQAILTERNLELFAEWGHRWLDLKRMKQATNILQPIKGANWQATDELYPIPQIEIIANPGIRGHQNPGY
jgi:starch-binding outer membrane protein, SusD/RagB family